jgi:GTP-binding protein HflX
VCEADLLVHVVDMSDERVRENMLEVNEVLATIGAEKIPQLIVFNKVDLCTNLEKNIEHIATEQFTRVWVSAQTGQGLNELNKAIEQTLSKNLIHHSFILMPNEGKLRAQLYEKRAVISERIDDEGHCHLEVKLALKDFKKLF